MIKENAVTLCHGAERISRCSAACFDCRCCPCDFDCCYSAGFDFCFGCYCGSDRSRKSPLFHDYCSPTAANLYIKRENTMALPIEFLNKMRLMLENRFVEYENALSEPPFRAMRINTIKADKELLKKHFQFVDTPTEFCDESYYLPPDTKRLGNHPLHHAGAFYLQEPSASSVVEAIGIEEGDFVLDLCASPGGKSTQAAAKLNNTGLLVSNEFVASRVKPLTSNIERMGIVNAIVYSQRPDRIAESFCDFFDKVIVDAPCSGEGMFRKESAAVENWSEENVRSCAERQLKILESAAQCVKPGGKIVYSTCTYSFEENEGVIARFLKNRTDFKLVKPIKNFGEPAFARYAPDTENIEYARRIFNFNGGEGHFAAVLIREGETEPNGVVLCPDLFDPMDKELKLFAEFYKENFEGEVPLNTVNKNGFVYITPFEASKNEPRPVQSGVLAGVCKNNRFIPEHSLYNNTVFVSKRHIDLAVGDERLYKFLHGEEISCDGDLKGYTQVRCEGIPLGFGKASSGVLKNHYPKGIRTL